MFLDSKPHTIRGFKFKGFDTVYPEWFEDYQKLDKAQVVINTKNCHITLYDKQGNSRKAYRNDWVCVNLTETLFPLSDQEVKQYFKLREEN